MLKLTFLLKTNSKSAEWVKEHIAMTLERWGDIRLVNVEDVEEIQNERKSKETAKEVF